MSFKALHAAMLDQLDDAIRAARAAIPPQEYMLKNPERKAWETPDEPGYPADYHASLIEVMRHPDQLPAMRDVVGVRWWPALDRLCELRERWHRYHRDI